MNSDINYIIQKAIKGDKIFQEKLIKRLNPLIYKNIYLYCNPTSPLVEDLVQEGYMVILESLKEYRESRNVHYLRYVQVKLHYFYKNYFKNKNNTTISIENLIEMRKEPKAKTYELKKIISIEERNTLMKCMEKLPEKQQKYYIYFILKECQLKR